MHTFRQVALTSVVLCATILTPATGVAASRWLELSPSHGPTGTSVTVSGHGFPYQYCAAYATLWWAGHEADAQRVKLAQDDTDPSFVLDMIVPPDAQPPNLTLKSLCGTGEISEPGPSAVFTVEPASSELFWVTVAPARGPAGSTVEMSGGGLAACNPGVLLWWRGQDQDMIVPVDPATGRFRTDIVVPAGHKPGELELVATCLGGDYEDLVTKFTVLAPDPQPPSRPGPPTTTAESTTGTTTSIPDPGKEGGVGEQNQPDDTRGDTGRVDESDVTSPGSTGSASTSNHRVHPVRMTDTLPVASQLRFSLAIALILIALTGLLILLIAFPAELFNKTYERHQTEIHRILHVHRTRFPRWLGGVVFVLVSVVLSVMLAGDEGAAGNPLAQILGFLVAIPVVTFTYCLPSELLSRRRSRINGLFEVLPSALAVAVVCAALSSLLALDPPYVYGLFAGFAAIRPRRLTAPQKGSAVLTGAICLAVVGTTAWLAWSPVHAAAYGPTPTWPAVITDAALFWTFVLAAEGLVFALMPLRYLDGETLKKWRLANWLAPQTIAIAAFAYILILRTDVNPPGGGIAAVLKALAFFLIFGLFSVAFRKYFRWPGRPTRHLAGASQPVLQQTFIDISDSNNEALR